LSGHSEIRQLGVTLGVEEDVSGLHVSVDLLAEVQIFEACGKVNNFTSVIYSRGII
jgi:hypothetical protein